MLTSQEIFHLYDIVMNFGNIGSSKVSQGRRAVKAEKRIREEYEKAANAANKRMQRLEEQGLDVSSPAYQQAQYFLGETMGRDRFSRSKKMKFADMMEQYEEILKFLNDETSTVTGEKRRRSGVDKLMPAASKKEKNAMMRFLSSKAFEELKKVMGTDIVRRGADAIEQGAKVSDLTKLFKDFLKREKQGDITVNEDIYTEVWSPWIGEIIK